MMHISAEIILALGYAGFLVAVAALLELIARHVHRRSEQATTAGFTYRRDLDVWECPDGRSLHREETDTLLRVSRYRAEAHHCNACVFKFRCTDSSSGRVIEQRSDSWLDSGLYRFHRGISLALLVLAGMILFVEMIRNQYKLQEEVLLAVSFISVGTLGLRLFRRTFRSAI
ncbi:MAG TPA: hypothetical protein VN622_15960 [Clostridia bacterium]|nr:hypothetical protein [Clostridia bacterium]